MFQRWWNGLVAVVLMERTGFPIVAGVWVVAVLGQSVFAVLMWVFQLVG